MVTRARFWATETQWQRTLPDIVLCVVSGICETLEPQRGVHYLEDLGKFVCRLTYGLVNLQEASNQDDFTQDGHRSTKRGGVIRILFLKDMILF